jgi:hypothetical protein
LIRIFPRAGSNPAALLIILGWVLLAGPFGCISHDRSPASLEQSPAYDMPPKQMFQAVRQIVSAPPIALPVQDEQAGSLLTGWQSFRGEFHIARYWYERTRYHISVVPDFNDPAHRSHIQITDETQQRPDESGLNVAARQWTPAPDLHRSARSAALLQKIENGLANYPR